jgi:hypothetical protein
MFLNIYFETPGTFQFTDEDSRRKIMGAWLIIIFSKSVASFCRTKNYRRRTTT